jgi:hypothetical protein
VSTTSDLLIVQTTIFVVILVDVLKGYNCLETKFYEMMSQIDSFMTMNHFPLTLQKKMKDYYYYKYRRKYYKETTIEKYISGTTPIGTTLHR